jgi:hypothetical protein
MMKRPGLLAHVVLPLALAASDGGRPAAADPAPPAAAKSAGVRPRPRAPRLAPSGGRVAPARGAPVRTYEFTADVLDGSRVRPDGSTLFGLRGAQHSNLIELRGDFLPEITRSAEDLP